MRASLEPVQESVTVVRFPFMRPSQAALKRWTRSAIEGWLIDWCFEAGITTTARAAPGIAALASEYRRLLEVQLLYKNLNLNANQAAVADTLVKYHKIIGELEQRVKMIWKEMGVYPLVRGDAKPKKAAPKSQKTAQFQIPVRKLALK